MPAVTFSDLPRPVSSLLLVMALAVAAGCGQPPSKVAAATSGGTAPPGAAASPAAAASPDTTAAPPVVVPALVTAPSGGVDIDLSGSPTRAASTVAIPTKIDISAIGVHAQVISLGRNLDGTLQVPDSFTVAGWYQDGPRPGDPGPAVIAGHVDSFRGPGVFFRLKDLRPGDVIQISSVDVVHQFRVQSVETFPKDRFPTAQVYGPVPDRALRLATCGGSFDEATRSYRANVVVFATEVTS